MVGVFDSPRFSSWHVEVGGNQQGRDFKASEHQSSIIPCILPIPSILRLSLAAGFFQTGRDGGEDGAAG
jgi:hypothetical protein